MFEPTHMILIDRSALYAGAILAIGLVLLATRLRHRRQLRDTGKALAAMMARLEAGEAALAGMAERCDRLQVVIDEYGARQQAGTSLSGHLRQAIALSRHGAGVRQLAEACGLSDGEAHLIHTLYGRSDAPVGELH